MSYVGLYDDAGSRNAFYIIKNKKIGRKKVGFKEFENKRKADFAHRIQSHLSRYDLAPMVYGQVGRIRKPDGDLTHYGYLTEVARPMPCCGDPDCYNGCFESCCNNGMIIESLVSELADYGLDYCDGHRGNFGFVRRNNKWIPVVIDVGVESFTAWDRDIYGGWDYESDECDCSSCRMEREQYV